jgi:hypothetical protein
MKRISTLLLVLWLSLPGLCATYYVDGDSGNDANAGTSAAAPWKTIGKVNQQTLLPGDIVYFKGTFSGEVLSLNESGTAQAPIVLDGVTWSGTRAALYGSVPWTPTWTQCASAGDAFGNANYANIYYTTPPAGWSSNTHAFIPIFEDGEIMHFSQSPSPRDPWHYDRAVDLHAIPRGQFSVSGSTATITSSALFTSSSSSFFTTAWAGFKSADNWLVLNPITAFNPSSDTITVTGSMGSGLAADANIPFTILNHPAYIDAPGEYAYRTDTNRVYVWARAGDPNSATWRVSTQKQAIELNGSSYITIRGFQGGHTYGLPGEQHQGNMVHKYFNETPISGITVENCVFSQCRSMVKSALINIRVCSDVTIRNNQLTRHQNGMGVLLQSGDGFRIHDNFIEKTGALGIWVQGSSDVAVYQNIIRDIHGMHANGMSFYLGNQDLLVMNNYVYNVQNPMTLEDWSNVYIIGNLLESDGQYGIACWHPVGGKLYILNNTIPCTLAPVSSAAANSAIVFTDISAAEVVLTNNILDGYLLVTGTIDLRSYNLYTGLAWQQESSYGWTLGLGESVQTDWLQVFTNYLGENYVPLDSSPADDGGLNVSAYYPTALFPDVTFGSDQLGNALGGGGGWNIGAFEEGGALPATPTPTPYGTPTPTPTVQARTYYVDATDGSDSNNGLSPATAFQTLAKINALTLNPGDTVRLQRGETWYEALQPAHSGASGAPITIADYGTGDRPRIDGTSTLPSTWTLEAASGGGGEDFTDGTGAAPVAYWLFENDATDAGASGFDLTTEGGETIAYSATAQHGVASVDLTGVASNYLYANDASLSSAFPGKAGGGYKAFTLSGWVYLDATPGSDDAGIFGKIWSYGIRFDSTSGKFEGYVVDSGWTHHPILSNDAAATGAWVHLALRWSYGTTNELALFVNGVKQTATATVTTMLNEGSYKFTVGYESAYTNAKFDELAVFAAALTDDQIGDLYATGLSGGTGTAFDLYYQAANAPVQVSEDNVLLTEVADKSSMTEGTWTYDSGTGRLYLRTADDTSPADNTVRTHIGERGIDLSGRSYVTVHNLEILDVSGTAVYAENGANLKVGMNILRRGVNGLDFNDSASCQAYYNAVYNLSWDGLRLSGSASGHGLYNNAVYGTQRGIAVGVENATAAAVTGNRVANNLVMNCTGAELYANLGGDNNATQGSGNLYDHNGLGVQHANFINWGGVAYGTYAAWRTVYGLDDDSLESDPLWTDAATGDFRLTASSPARDAGASVGLYTDFYGNNPVPSNGVVDLGLHEYQVTTAPTPTPTSAIPSPTPIPTATPTPSPTPAQVATLTFDSAVRNGGEVLLHAVSSAGAGFINVSQTAQRYRYYMAADSVIETGTTSTTVSGSDAWIRARIPSAFLERNLIVQTKRTDTGASQVFNLAVSPTSIRSVTAYLLDESVQRTDTWSVADPIIRACTGVADSLQTTYTAAMVREYGDGTYSVYIYDYDLTAVKRAKYLLNYLVTSYADAEDILRRAVPDGDLSHYREE